MSTLQITHLSAVARREVACAEIVATICGAWVSDPQPSTQRALWADIAQAYSWYAESWQSRLPIIPAEAGPAPDSPTVDTAQIERTRELLTGAIDDAARLRVLITAVIPSTLGRLESLAPQIDRRLDPATVILIDRIQMDLNRLLYAASHP